METIQNPYISLELEALSLDSIRATLQTHLSTEGFQTECPSRSAHVSLGYATCSETEERLENLAQRLCGYQIELQVTGVEVLEGLTTPFDYIVLTLEENEGFRQAKRTVDGELPTRNFPGGFKAHVTLLQVPKGSWTMTAAHDLQPRLEEAARPFCGCTKVCAEKLAVFDQDKRCRIERNLSRAA